jgi:hypothetical protein
LKLHWAEGDRLQQEHAELATVGAEQPASAAAASAAVGGCSLAGGLIVSRSAPPAPAAPVLANVQQLDPEEEEVVVEVRGICDGCNQNVMSNDEGRKREGRKYYHEDCIKGLCGGCGRIVHADADRVRLSGVYWHSDCL